MNEIIDQMVELYFLGGNINEILAEYRLNLKYNYMKRCLKVGGEIMVIRIYNLETGENFELDENIENIGNKLKEEMENRNWESIHCRVEVLDYE